MEKTQKLVVGLKINLCLSKVSDFLNVHAGKLAHSQWANSVTCILHGMTILRVLNLE